MQTFIFFEPVSCGLFYAYESVSCRVFFDNLYLEVVEGDIFYK